MVASVQTAIRIRPRIANQDEALTVSPESKVVTVENRASCNCDYIFTPEISHGFVYDACMVHRINQLFDGNDIYVIACGSCLTGKSLSLFELSFNEYEIRYGLAPLAVHHIFNSLSRLQLHNYFRYSVYINLFEIIDGEVNDLLSIDGKKTYTLTTDNKGSKCVAGIENILCRNVNEVFGCLKVGHQSKIGNRNNHEDCNSHTVFIVSVYQQWIYSGGYENRVSKATFIDLGSSDPKVSCDNDNNFFSEILSHISSERTLNRSIQSDKSFLSALIKDAVTVSPSTLILCCLSPSSDDFDQTVEYVQLIQQIREQFSANNTDEPICDSNTETSSQELDNYSHQDIYISLATTQWMKLIVNAEGLFQRLSVSSLPKEEKQQIDSWLCLKQEYDECFSESPPAPFQKVLKSLECIEEVTESEGGTSLYNSSNSGQNSISSETETINNDISGCATSTELPSKPEMASCLDSMMTKFCSDTNDIVDKMIMERFNNLHLVDSSEKVSSPRNYRRRKTVLPEEVSLALSNISGEGDSSKPHMSDKRSEPLEKPLPLLSPEHRTTDSTESKQSQLDMIMKDLEGAHKRIEELNNIIKVKEEFIGEMIHDSSIKNNCKEKLQKKLCKLEEEYFKTRASLARTDKSSKGGEYSQVQFEKFKTLSQQYEKRLNDLALVKELARDSSKKVLELESNVYSSKRKLQKLLKQLKREEQNKLVAESEFKEDQQRIREVALKLASNSRIKEIEQEEIKLKSLRESSQKLETELLQQRGVIEKREALFKEKISQMKSSSQHFLDIDSCSTDDSRFAGAITEDVRESLIHEIRNLRKARDSLVEQRRKLDHKVNKDKIYSPEEERKFLECDEAIDAIDAAIEYKNEIMLGHSLSYEKRGDWEETEDLLAERLLQLSLSETRSLLAKYFRKAVDLREAGRRLEQQASEAEAHAEAQAWRARALGEALQRARADRDRRMVMLHRDRSEKMHLMLRHGSANDEEAIALQNEALQRRVIELETMLRLPHPHPPALIPAENMQKLSATSSGPLTKVTRSKNKLIIQQQKGSKKRSK